MSKQIFEEAPEQKPMVGGAGAKAQLLKQARQLAYDTKYKVKQSLGKQTSMNPAQVAKAYLAQLAKSTASPAIKALAKKIILGEEYLEDINTLVETTINNALYRVFVDNAKEEVVEEENEYLKELQEKVNQKGERLYHIRVTDKKSGNTYTRDASRAKIAELRANPNISSVEMTGLNKDSDEEKTKGENTAKVKSGKGLKNDGNLANNYPPYDKVTRGDIIAGATGKDQMGGKKKFRKEEFIGEVKEDENEVPKVEGLKKGKKNNVKVFPEVSEQTVSPTQSSATKTVEDPKKKQQNQSLERVKQQEIQILQRKLQALKSAPKGTDPSIMASYEPEGDGIQEVAPPGMEVTVKAMKKHPEIDNPYALAWWMKGKGYKSHKKPSGAMKEDCGCEDKKESKPLETKEVDPREMSTKINMVRNKFRAMGLKMSYDLEGEMTEAWYSGKGSYRTTVSGRKVRRDEPDEAEQLRQSDMIAKNPRVQAERRAAAKARLTSKGILPIKKPK